MDVDGEMRCPQLNNKRKVEKREKGRKKRIKHPVAVDAADIFDEEKEWKRWNRGATADLTKEQREPLRKLVDEALEILSPTNITTTQVIFGTVMSLNRGNPVQWGFGEVKGMLYFGVRLGFYTLTGCRFHLAAERSDALQGTSLEESLAAPDAHRCFDRTKAEDDENPHTVKAENTTAPSSFNSFEMVSLGASSPDSNRQTDTSPVRILAPLACRMNVSTYLSMHTFSRNESTSGTYRKPATVYDPDSATAKPPFLDFTEDWTATIQSAPSVPVTAKQETVSEPAKRAAVSFSDDWTALLDSSAPDSGFVLRQSTDLPYRKHSATESFGSPPAITIISETLPQSPKNSGFFKRFLGQNIAL